MVDAQMKLGHETRRVFCTVRSLTLVVVVRRNCSWTRHPNFFVMIGVGFELGPARSVCQKPHLGLRVQISRRAGSDSAHFVLADVISE